ncbi:hypothetical protein BD289DRAFT_148529 [Coniella lustricola]|uniref:C2H2-type domain-containing protein n=1 Tax=Coniella lustricola TaxID=2025994 RepID=A0A2T2ZUU3_9PEZI|nr:hypothetical protein BD289DRAFT_148529 [Coniella lustricola]
MTCPYAGCGEEELSTWSGWKRHKPKHWPTKFGCIICAFKTSKDSYTCKSCKMKFKRQPDLVSSQKDLTEAELQQAESHILGPEGCQQTREAIRSKKAGWWQPQNQGAFREHLAHHKSLSDSQRQIAETVWSITIEPEDRTCNNCNLDFSSWDGLETHYESVHLICRPRKRRSTVQQKQKVIRDAGSKFDEVNSDPRSYRNDGDWTLED